MVLLIAWAAPGAFAQSAAQCIAWGDRASSAGDDHAASRYYAEALRTAPGILETQWKYAEACRRSDRYEEAALYYDRVVHKDRGIRHPEALRWLAEMKMSLGRYDEAARNWTKVQRKAGRKDPVTAARAANAIEGCRMAEATHGGARDSLRLEHLPEPVNGPGSEFAARIGPDSALWFTALRGAVDDDGAVLDTAHYHARIYRTRETAAGWTEPEPANLPGPAARDRANITWSPDGNWRYYAEGDGHGLFRIMALARGADQATVVLSESGASCTQPMVAVVDSVPTLFFTRTDPKDGNRDIWSCPVHGAQAGEAKPLGSAVNTPGNECCPFYDERTRTLWFSSDFLPGLGGYDLFKSALTPAGFSPAEHAGTALNSPANDLYPAISAQGAEGWLASNRAGSFTSTGETCCNDLYRWRLMRIEPPPDTLPKDTAAIAATRTRRITSLREKLPIRLYFHNDEPDPRSWDTVTTQDYGATYRSYAAKLPEYDSAWQATGADTTAFDVFFRDRVTFGRNRLDEFIALLGQALGEGQHIELQVRGFASPLAKSDYNRNLSLRRIESLVLYLRKAQDGLLLPYINGTAPSGGRLDILKLPYGKSRADAAVSDRLDDRRHSVYGVGAAQERRIEIEQVLDRP